VSAAVGTPNESDDATVDDAALDTGNWPQDGFDERNTGYSPDATAVAAFPQIDWRFDIGVDHEGGGIKDTRTIARSAVSVVDGNAFVGDRAGSTSPGFFYSMNATTGEYRWRSRLTAFNPGMQTTPAVSGGRVFYGDDAGTLRAQSAANGSTAWSVDLGSGTASGVAYSPTVVGNTLYVTNDAGKLFAYDTSNGSQKWVQESSRSYPGRHAPAVADGRVYYATSTGAGGAQLYAVDPGSGNGIWNRTFAGVAGYRMTTPTVGADTLYVSDPGRSRLLAVSPDNGTTLWDVSVDADIRDPPAYAEGVVYVTDESGSLYAVDEDNRSIRWERELGDTFQSSPSVANGVVYAGDTNGELYAVDAGTGQRLWSERLDGSIDAAPTPIDGRVYVGGDNFVYAFEGPAEPWTVERTVDATDTGVKPGDTVGVTLNASVTELPPEGDLEIEETVSGPVANIAVDTVTVDGAATTPNRSTINANGLAVALDRTTVANAQAVTVTYTVSVLDSTTWGNSLGIDGRFAFNRSEQRISTEEVQVGLVIKDDPATNIDSDGLLEDIDGDGDLDQVDVLTYYRNRKYDIVRDNPQYFDFDGDGTAGTVSDALELYKKI
jgi:outer membrane protein assembly factor BamB